MGHRSRRNGERTSIVESDHPREHTLEVAGLQPGTAYHYRLLAANGQGQTPGEERTFTTQGPASLALPDHRGYELVSPAEKRGANISPIQETGIVQAAAGVDSSNVPAGHVLLLPVDPDKAPPYPEAAHEEFGAES